LRQLYVDDIPDVIVYDFMSPAGKHLAGVLRTRAIEHSPTVINENDPLALRPHDEELVLVSVPRFFQRDAEALDQRFQFVGFIQNGRTNFFTPWRASEHRQPAILITATTGLLPQTDFFRNALAAFGNTSWHLVLAISDDIDPAALAPAPVNCEIRRSASTFQILESACLVIGQGGQGSTLEALYWGVPQLLIPPSPIHDDCAARVAELGLGTRVPQTEATPEKLKHAGIALLEDREMRMRLREVARTMQANKGAEMAANLITQSR
jgi:MGT family glycosyltransferase